MRLTHYLNKHISRPTDREIHHPIEDKTHKYEFHDQSSREDIKRVSIQETTSMDSKDQVLIESTKYWKEA
jgi:hypothetical protein